MDQQKLVELLQSCQIPDTQKVKAATAELKRNYYPHPDALIGLLHILVSHPEENVRQLSAVQSLRLVPKHWAKINGDQKTAIRNEIVQAVIREQHALVRHALSRVIAAVAALDFEDEEWADLLPVVFQLTTSDNVAHREVGSYIIFALLEANPTYFSEHLPKLFELFVKTIKDPQSRDVRLNTMLSISCVLLLIDAEEDEASAATIQEFVPAMVDVLKDFVENHDEDRTRQAFEVFQAFLGYESSLLARYFRDLLQFMLDLAANKNADEEVRSQALAFLTQCVRYRRMKIQGIPDMASQLTKKAMMILGELEDDDDDDDITPARSALELIDQMSTDLPPRQVVVPLLDDFPKYASSENAGFRRAAVMSLGVCAEGAPDFVSTQIQSLMPTVIQLLNDSNRSVRHDALVSLMRMGEDLAETMKANHEPIMTALVKNLEAASEDQNDEKNIEIIRSVCGSIDTMSEGFGSEVMNKYAEGLISRVGRLLNHPDVKVKSAAAGALGAVALSIESAFKPYLKDTMEAMSSYVMAESGEDELSLRSSVCDAMGRIAVGVGAEDFQPYVMPLLTASEKALDLGNARLRETTFILWSQLARVYDGDLGAAMEGIFKGLFDSLELEEEDTELPEDIEGLIDGDMVTGGKKMKIKASDEGEDEDEMDDDDDDSDWDDIVGVSAAAMEKEVAIEVLGDVITHAKEKSAPYLERAVELITPMAEHTYEGCRKAAVSTLWRTYACVWQIMEQHTGVKWEAGLPLKFEPAANVVKLGEVVANATHQMWSDESDRDVVTEINRNIAATLKTCGPAILGQKNMMEQTITCLGCIITRAHPCQQDLGDEEEEADVQGGTSEWDWLVIDTALDVIIGLAAALGPQFAEVWKVFEKPIMKLVSSNESIERSTAVGVIAECTAYMGAAVTPYTKSLLPAMMHRLSDEDKETKSNAAYAVGQLIYHSTDSATYLSSYVPVLSKLEPLLQISESRLQDNATGCICRMILAHPDKVPLADVLPIIVGLLPLKEDFEENKPVYECIGKLYELQNPTIQALTPQLMSVFEKVLGPPEDQLETDTRQGIEALVRMIRSS
ncbi:armadillo-type protein [Pseudomassariella vexata]|uniref:Armadillo-type protein n=1 Tax=Pseudomassariella vexata TaxID=1141098 RepID=A0A1Y2DRL9_9PEZI|nr:armadillo-type protein [Pseudomassariella vexata]ORY61794.1 armadillo-type protein [Pseudomassariella vexata]